MLKKAGRGLCAALIAAALLAAGVYFMRSGPDGSVKTAPRQANATDGKALLEDTKGALQLALKSISLSQGEGGFELWRLKAEWANMQKQDGLVVIEQPRLTYFMKEEGKILNVRSERGDIEQKEQIIRFLDAVRVSQDDRIITGPIMVYNGTAKTMTLPDGGAFSTENARGRAESIVWHINEQRMEGDGGVSVFLDGAGAPPVAP